MSYLLDTNVISETRKPRPHGAVTAWLDAVRREQRAISAVTLGELQRGVELRRPHDPEDARHLEAFIERVVAVYRIIDMDGRCFRRWAKLMIGRPPHLIADAMIAATALEHDLTIVTRNVRDFQTLGLTVVDPFVDRR